MVTLLLVTVVFSSSRTSVIEATNVQSIDVTSRQQVMDSYAEEFLRQEPAMEFTGNVAACIPGTTSMAFQNSVLQRVNWYRMMAGLPSVVYNSANHAAAQAGALISAAQGALSHTPTPSAKCFSQLGYTGTSSSNLAGGNSGVSAIDAYIDDYGDNNSFVGHRRWILSPTLRAVSTGDIPQSKDSKYLWPSNALYVFDTQSAVAARDGGVAWPPRGYVPAATVASRWSYIYLGANFSNAQVSVTGPDGPVSTSIQNRGDFVGAGIVFTPGITKSRVADTTYTIVISGITGAPTSTVTYTTTLVPFNSAPTYNGINMNGHRCSGSSLSLSPEFSDNEYDSFNITWDSSSPDSKFFNYYPAYSSKGFVTSLFVTAKSTLDPMRNTYTIPMTAKDVYGATNSWNVVINIPDPKATTLCAPRSPTVKRIRSGTKFSWQSIPLGAKPSKFVVKLSPGGKTCKTSSTSCTIAGLKKGTYSVTVTAIKAGSKSVSVTKRLTIK
ncbi:MAG: hypothetical protein RL374_23 [Actinomycetota bacterium]|jgi:uncharacterized protein YkwD